MKTIEEVIMTGNLMELTPEQRLEHYQNTCRSLSLNPSTVPLAYLEMDDRDGRRRLLLYVLRDGTNQFRKLNGISVIALESRIDPEEIITYTVGVQDASGRKDISTGSVSLQGKTGQARADAMMAAETKAKRRATLDLSGCGLLDESEVAEMSSKVTILDPGIGTSVPKVSAAPVVEPGPVQEAKVEYHVTEVPATLPEHSGSTLKVVEPPAPVAPPSRIVESEGLTKDQAHQKWEAYLNDHLRNGGMMPSLGMSIPKKWNKFVLHETNKTELKAITLPEMTIFFQTLDEIRSEKGDKGLVEFINQILAKI